MKRVSVPSTHNQFPDNAPVIAVNLHKIIAAKAAADEARADLAATIKHAKDKGIHLPAAKDAIAAVRSGKVDEMIAYTKSLFLYLRILRHGVTDDQMSLDLQSALAPGEERASEDGRFAGMSGDEVTETANPHALDTRQGQAWLAAFRDGRTQRDTILSMADELEAEDDED
jgi:hypothetical protein